MMSIRGKHTWNLSSRKARPADRWHPPDFFALLDHMRDCASHSDYALDVRNLVHREIHARNNRNRSGISDLVRSCLHALYQGMLVLILPKVRGI